MKRKIMYTCEICNTSFASEEKANQCENSHKQIECIEKALYQPHKKKPYKLVVRYSDGEIGELKIEK